MSEKKNVHPVAWVPSAYFAMGLPFIAINLVSAYMFKDLGITDTQIAFWTSLIMMPWTLKFLWSPFVEMYRTKRFFVITTQLISGLLFGVIALTLKFDYFFAISIATMAIIAFSGATHDIACDGVYMSELSSENQAEYIGVQGAFYNIAKIVANGGLVALAGFLAEHFGAREGASFFANLPAYENAWMIIFAAISAMLILLATYHLMVLPGKQRVQQQNRGAWEVMVEMARVIVNFFTKKYIIIYILFIVLYRFAEGLVIKIAPLFLRSDVADGGMGLSLAEAGTINGIVGSSAFVLGSLLAGVYVSKLGLKRTLFTLCCVFNFPFAVYALLSFYQPENIYLIATGIGFEYFGYGFGYIGLTLFMMQQVAPGKYQMSHYAFASAIANFGVMIPGMVSGWLSDHLGYQQFFLYALLAAIPALLIAWFIPFTYGKSGELLTEKK